MQVLIVRFQHLQKPAFLEQVIHFRAGFLYMISQGNSSKVAASKTTLVNAIIGLVIASLSVALTNFVVNLIAS